MAVSATVTPGKIFASGESVTVSELNKLGNPTVDISGAVGTLSLSDGSVTNAKIATGAAIQHDKLATLNTGELIVGNAGTPTATALAGDATIDASGNLTIAAGAVEHSMLATGLLPSGSIMQYAGLAASLPAGWLLCDGSAKDSVTDTTLANLYTAISTTYGGTGAADFNLPDLRGRIPVGTNDAGLPNGLLTSDTARPTERNEGATGGAETHTLTTPEMPAHTHELQYNSITTSAGANSFAVDGTDAPTTTTSSTGGGGAHNNLQPYIVLNYIIKT